ncbi:MAG: hypothetical protein KDD11_16190 [Acidobacteria bacterium]|nr:hypothetical protein [Acidobacteriota bacterium]
MKRARPAAVSGFGLVEALVALTILAITLLLGAAAVGQHLRIVQSLEARRGALLAAEAVAESLRAGAVEVESGSVHWTAVPPPLPPGVDLELDVTPIEPPGLAQVQVTASYQVRGDRRKVVLDTMTWTGP